MSGGLLSSVHEALCSNGADRPAEAGGTLMLAASYPASLPRRQAVPCTAQLCAALCSREVGAKVHLLGCRWARCFLWLC